MALAVASSEPTTLFLVLRAPAPPHRHMLVAFSLESQAVMAVLLRMRDSCNGLVARAVSPKSASSIVAAVCGKSLFVVESPAGRVRRLQHSDRITSLAVHPQDPYVATGDAAGRITFWHCLARAVSAAAASTSGGRSGMAKAVEVGSGAGGAAPAADVATTMLHWHAYRVRCLAFTHDGQYMQSGGEEAVLVSWQLRTGAQSFLPRLGAPLTALACSPDGAVVAVALRDNSVCTVSLAANKQQWCMRGLAMGALRPPALCAACTSRPPGRRDRCWRAASSPDPVSQFVPRRPCVDPRTGALVLGGMPGSGCLQFYDVLSARHLMQLEVRPLHSPAPSRRPRLPPSRRCRTRSRPAAPCSERTGTPWRTRASRTPASPARAMRWPRWRRAARARPRTPPRSSSGRWTPRRTSGC